MAHLTNQTKSISEKSITRNWHMVDMKDQVLGRMIPQISTLLQGKHKVNYVPYLDVGDYVVVVNAAQVNVTGKKELTKKYTYFSGFPGGLREVTLQNMRIKNPQEIIIHAVKGMLPKNKLRDQRLTRLYVFADAKHPYAHQFTKQG